MDEPTARYYDENAAAVAERYESVVSPVSAFAALAFPRGSRVLDIGAGSGRDLSWLIDEGYDAYGVEPSEGLRTAALKRHPKLAGRLVEGALPWIAEPFGGTFDGVLCSAVLMHVPEADLFDSALALRRLLRPHGRLLLSLPQTRGDVAADRRDAMGRLFADYAAEYVRLLFERLGFQLIGQWNSGDALGRDGTTWYTLLFELRSSAGLRAVDQIEGILNRDKKVATYKLALFRSLAEIATQEPHVVSWEADGRVGIPIENIARRWLGYYWPIFASDRFVPQSQDEGKRDRAALAFRAPVLALMAAYAGQGAHGGLSVWHLAWTTGTLSPEAQALVRRALASIASTIVSGPVTHSGGSLETGSVFSYDGRRRLVLMSADLWHELSLLGHWILDAVVLRWAELTERFSRRQGLRSGDVLPVILAKPEPERATGLARQVFVGRQVNECTWSGRAIGRRFAVDHVIPFSLWGNNDLWNLLPVDEKVNGQKSDKLPAASLLLDRRAAIVEAWGVLRDALPLAFDRQMMEFVGRRAAGPRRWDHELFTRLREAVEITALQRGIERWSPRV